jgi:hypothetical protein
MLIAFAAGARASFVSVTLASGSLAHVPKQDGAVADAIIGLRRE